MKGIILALLMMTVAFPAHAQLGPGPSPSNGTVSNPLTLGTQNSSQGSLVLAGPASGSFGGALTLNNAGSSGAPSFTLFNGAWFQGGGPVPTFRPNTIGDHVALDLSANGTSNSTWIDACSTDIPADAAAHSGTIENYTCAHFESDPSGSVYVYSNIYTSSVFQTPGTLYLNQNPNGGSPDYGPVDIPGALTVGNGISIAQGNYTFAFGTGAGTSNFGPELTGNVVPFYSVSDGTHQVRLGISTTGELLTTQSSPGDFAILASNASSESTAIHFSAQYPGFNDNMALMTNGDVEIGTGTAISTSATGGFLALETMNGVPTGTPAKAATGFAQCVVNYSSKNLNCYINGAWVHYTGTAGAG